MPGTIVDGTLSPGNSPGTLTVNGNLVLNAGSVSLFELATSGVVGGGVNDLVVVLFPLSVAEQDTVVAPARNSDPGGGVQLTVSADPLSDADGCV